MSASTLLTMISIAAPAFAVVLAIALISRNARRPTRWNILQIAIGAVAISAMFTVVLDDKDAEANAGICATLKPAAASTMNARQVGAPASGLLKNINEISAQNRSASRFADRELFAELDRILRELVAEAYERPRYETRPLQQRANDDFAEEKYRLCIEDRWFSIPPLWIRAVVAQVTSAWERGV